MGAQAAAGAAGLARQAERLNHGEGPAVSLTKKELLLTTLALLEAELRGSEAPQGGMTAVPTSGSRMGQLQGFFGADFEDILAGVRLRHDLLQNLAAKPGEMENRARKLEEIVRRRRNLPSA